MAILPDQEAGLKCKTLIWPMKNGANTCDSFVKYMINIDGNRTAAADMCGHAGEAMTDTFKYIRSCKRTYDCSC